MDLTTFRNHLQDIDKRSEFEVAGFNCDATQHDQENFSFVFDGIVMCVVKFHLDNTVSEWQDSNYPPDGITPIKFQSIQAWKDACVKEMKEWER